MFCRNVDRKESLKHMELVLQPSDMSAHLSTGEGPSEECAGTLR